MMIHHTSGGTMPKAKIAITIERDLLRGVDAQVGARRFASRSEAIAQAVARDLDHLRRTRLARECAKLDARAERREADEGLSRDIGTWPAY
jgi:Arc/MetJ-type ribon-helix-helix transcriptional regulator